MGAHDSSSSPLVPFRVQKWTKNKSPLGRVSDQGPFLSSSKRQHDLSPVFKIQAMKVFLHPLSSSNKTKSIIQCLCCGATEITQQAEVRAAWSAGPGVKAERSLRKLSSDLHIRAIQQVSAFALSTPPTT